MLKSQTVESGFSASKLYVQIVTQTLTLTLLRAVGDRFENITCILWDDLSQFPYSARAGGTHVALWLKDSHPIICIAHDDDLSLSSRTCDVWARAVPVHVEEGDLERFLAKET